MTMIHTLAAALLAAGMGSPASTTANPAQPSPQFNTAPEVYFYSSPGRSYLGIDIQDVTSDRVGPLKLKEERGVEITMVDQDAPAGKAGLKEHDVILDFNGTAVESEEQLRRMLREIPPGRTVTMGISRDGNPMKISVQLGDRNKIFAQNRPRVVIPPMPRLPDLPVIEVPGYSFQLNMYSSSLGIQTEPLSRQLQKFFAVPEGLGILVRSVETGSPAEKAGLKAGDCIIRADDEKITDRADLSHVLRNHREGGKVTLGIVRDKHEQTIVIELPKKGSSDSSWRYFDSDQWESYWGEIEKELEDLEPEIDHVRDIARTRARVALADAKRQMAEWQPQIERAKRQTAAEMRRAQRALEQAQRELRSNLRHMI